jgi:hypothetical protein
MPSEAHEAGWEEGFRHGSLFERVACLERGEYRTVRAA